MEMVKRNHYLIVFQNRVVCKPEDFCFRAMELLDYPEFVFLVILSDLTVQCVITIYRQGFRTLLMHFVSGSVDSNVMLLRENLDCTLFEKHCGDKC
jgi:hypothetical protein